MNIGIDKIGFYTPEMYLDMVDLAQARGIESGKYTVGLGQEKMAVAPIYEDAVTMAANAANAILDEADKKDIDLILVGSESGVDHSKSIAVYVQALSGLSARVRAVEIKQACYGATMGIQLAKSHILANPTSKVLVIATDIAKYGLNTPGEPTQGAGAVALVISANPKIARIEEQSTFYTEEIMDFWRPVYSDTAFADGKFSTEKYIQFFETVWTDYAEKANQSLADFSAICFHLPFTRLGYKALKNVLDKQHDEATTNRLLAAYEASKTYNKQVGNIYTGSLYLSLLSLLETGNVQAEQRIGLFSYGSGAVGEFFAIQIVAGFDKHLRAAYHQKLLQNREKLTLSAYEKWLTLSLPKDGSTYHTPAPKTSNRVYLAEVTNHQRIYRRSN